MNTEIEPQWNAAFAPEQKNNGGLRDICCRLNSSAVSDFDIAIGILPIDGVDVALTKFLPLRSAESEAPCADYLASISVIGWQRRCTCDGDPYVYLLRSVGRENSAALASIEEIETAAREAAALSAACGDDERVRTSRCTSLPMASPLPSSVTG